MTIYSLTKLVTATAILQLLESGKIASLDDPVEKYVPRISSFQVLEGFDDNEEPILRAPKTKPTVRQLATHTAGSTYHFYDETTKRWLAWREGAQGIAFTGRKRADFETPLRFDPGTAWAYGISIDWAGFVVEAVSGTNLDSYFREHIFTPPGLKKIGAPQVVAAEAVLHFRLEDRNLVVPPGLPNAAVFTGEKDEDPHQAWGGHYISATPEDYATFLLTILKGGTHPQTKVQILKCDTVEDFVFTDQLSSVMGPTGSEDVGVFKSANPMLSADGVLLPGTKKGWTAGLLFNREEVSGGRKAGSGGWAGLCNHYYWLDSESGKLGLVMTSILPFLDKEVLQLFQEFEKLVYKY